MLPGQNSRGSYGEFIELLKEDPLLFWKKYAPLHPIEELNNYFTKEQEEYLYFLLNQGEMLAIDETHLHLHVHQLGSFTPKADVIHLCRRASSFATSHLRSSWSSNTTLLRRVIRRLRHEYNKQVFWKRRDFLPGLNRHEVIGSHPLSKFGLILADAGYDAERIMTSSALVRLLAYWHYHYHYLEREGPRLFGDRFLSLRYEDFANDPQRIMTDIYQWLGMVPPDGVTYPDVHAPKPAFRANDRRWREAATIAGFSEEELETLL